MASFLSQLSAVGTELVNQPTSIKILVTFIILVIGFVGGRLLSRLFKRVYYARRSEDVVEKIKDRKRQPIKVVEYITAIITITIALVYLNSTATNQLFTQILDWFQPVLTAVLSFILGMLIVKIFMGFLTGFIDTVGFKQYAKDLGLSTKVLTIFFQLLKVFLYILLFAIVVTQLPQFQGADIVSETLKAASWGVVGLLVLLGFFGFKDLIQNYAAGIYLRGSDVLKPGKKVKLEDESGEIRDISAFGTTITTDTGYFMLTPNKELMDKSILFKRVKADVDTLEDIKNYFVAQEPSYCGPASAEMALSMFGYDIPQGTLADETGTTQPGGVKPDALMDGIENLTNGEVKTDFVEHSKITDVSDEFKTWFNDGGLIIVNFAKPELFPNAETAHYALSVGAEGNEALIIDPSAHTSSGGVYYVDSNEMLEAMEEWEGEEKGYIVMAPKGTTAHWRIEEGLIYSDKSFYEQLSKNLELQLGRIMRRGRILKTVMPDQVEDFLTRWRKEERVKRLWKAEKAQDSNGGDAKLDEFTDAGE
jgi:small-conductance mechanosensitive channel